MGHIASSFVDYIPKAVAAIVIVVAGFVVATLVRPAVAALLRRFRFDQACERVGVNSLMREGGISSSPSQFASLVVFWAIILFAVLAAALGPLGLQGLSMTLNQIILYLPRLLAAILIIMFGTAAARVVEGLVQRGLSEAGVRRTGTLGSIVRFGVIFIAAILAASLLGIQPTILIVVAIIGLGAVALTASLALGLGLRQLSQNVAANRYISERIEEGDEIHLDGVSGTVEDIGYATTTLRGANGRIYIIPNSRFLEHVVEKESGRNARGEL